jgi:hypothetical protein
MGKNENSGMYIIKLGYIALVENKFTCEKLLGKCASMLNLAKERKNELIKKVMINQTHNTRIF